VRGDCGGDFSFDISSVGPDGDPWDDIDKSEFVVGLLYNVSFEPEPTTGLVHDFPTGFVNLSSEGGPWAQPILSFIV
jgi:hypothetical protein